MGREHIWRNIGGTKGPWLCESYPNYQLRHETYCRYPMYWLITTNEDDPKVKANLGVCDYAEAQMRFLAWMEDKKCS